MGFAIQRILVTLSAFELRRIFAPLNGKQNRRRWDIPVELVVAAIWHLSVLAGKLLVVVIVVAIFGVIIVAKKLQTFNAIDRTRLALREQIVKAISWQLSKGQHTEWALVKIVFVVQSCTRRTSSYVSSRMVFMKRIVIIVHELFKWCFIFIYSQLTVSRSSWE